MENIEKSRNIWQKKKRRLCEICDRFQFLALPRYKPWLGAGSAEARPLAAPARRLGRGWAFKIRPRRGSVAAGPIRHDVRDSKSSCWFFVTGKAGFSSSAMASATTLQRNNTDLISNCRFLPGSGAENSMKIFKN